RCASGNSNGGGPFYFEIDGTKISPDISVADSGDWDAWTSQTVSNVELNEGVHILRLVVVNGEFNLGKMTFTYNSALGYFPPVAHAGSNVSVILPATTATLDGSQSSDADTAVLQYNWEQIYGPSVIAFSDNTAESPDISNLEEGIYKVKLTVDDGTYSSTSSVLVIVTETGNTNPTVSITSPANNTDYKEGEDITITATASDLDGAVARVEFYDGTTKLGEDTTQPYSYVWSGAAIGDHQIHAKAIDDSNGESTSQTINVSVNEVNICTQTGTTALQGSFSTGYKSTFETVGTNVIVTFELLDTDKEGVVAYLWKESPFEETAMDHVSGLTFSKTLSGFTNGETISYACKFAFAGGMAVTKYFSYEVGSNCNVSDDDNDGVTNDVDQCPDTPAGEMVNANGCSDSQLDDDNDGVTNDVDQCPDTPDGSVVNSDGCLVLPSDNLQLTVTGESCPDQNNGQLVIEAAAIHNYVATINGTDHSFTNDLVISDLSPGNYTVCISIAAQQFEQCYQITLAESNPITGKSSVKSGKASIEISTGTAPYSVYVNREKVLETNAKKFSVPVVYGDILEVSTAALCEGLIERVITWLDDIRVYPNPTKDNWILKTQNINIFSIKVFDILGKNVISLSPNKSEAVIEGARLKTGVYFAEIETISGSGRIKLIKN
ncbi:MAG: Ig-like domain-containing protein, partial [Lutibacter sp.]|nr:Ig-like domain-containing protein [Lutibacter sp.]